MSSALAVKPILASVPEPKIALVLVFREPVVGLEPTT